MASISVHNALSHSHSRSKMSILEKLLKKYPDASWDFKKLSGNPNLTERILDEHLNEGWDWYSLSMNPNITFEYIKKHTKYPWQWVAVSQNPNVTIKDTETNTNIAWDWKIGLSRNPNVTMEYIVAHPERSWDWKWGVSHNPNLTMEFVEKNPGKPWNWKVLSSHPNMTIDFVKKQLTQNWYNIMNPNITIEDIDEIHDPEFEVLSSCITIEFIEKNREQLEWVWHLLSANSNIKIEDIEAHPEYPWDLKFVSVNPNLTMEFIDKRASELDFGMISENKFTYERTRTTKMTSFMLLEKERTFHKLLNLFVATKYM